MRDKKRFIGVSMYLEVESAHWGHYFYFLLLETGPSCYVVISATGRSSRLQCKGTTFISQLFIEDLESGTVPGIEPATSHSAVKRSTDSANPGRSNHQWKSIFTLLFL